MNKKENKKVIFVNACLTGGGSERVMATLANHFADMGFQVTMILVRDKERTYEMSKKVNYVQITYKHKNLLYLLCKRLYEMRRIIKNSDAETVISFLTDINFFTILACFMLRKRVIISERAHPLLLSYNTKKPLYIRILRRILYPLADAIVFQTEFAKECYPPSIKKKGYIIPNPISPSLPDVLEGQRKKVIVAAGRLSEEKNFSMLITAFYEVSKIHKDYKLIIYGRGHLLKDLKKQRNNLNLQDKVEFPGYVDNILERIKDASIYVSSSYFEGISNSMLEALAMGIPSICTDCPVGGAAMVIKNEVNGVLIPVGDVSALRDAMLKIIEDKEFSKELSEEAVKVRDHYHVSRICKKWMDVI